MWHAPFPSIPLIDDDNDAPLASNVTNVDTPLHDNTHGIADCRGRSAPSATSIIAQ